jgi:josephin
LSRCAVHAANNLLQRRAFTSADFARVADTLTAPTFFGLLSPHRSVLPGVGDFDANVLLTALSGEGLSFRWVDKRVARALLSREAFPAAGGGFAGFIANRKAGGFLGWALHSRHWLCVREVAGTWLVFDSLAAAPRPLPGGLDEALAHLAALVDAGGEVLELWHGSGDPPPYLPAAPPLATAPS